MTDAAPSVPSPATLRYASGFVDITPTRPVPLAGHFGRTAAFEGIADELEANVVILYDGVQRIVFVTFDLLYVGGLLRRKLEAALQPAVRPEQLFLAASHTHFAPATDPTFALPELGAVAPDFVDMVVEKVSALVHQLLRSECKRAEISLGEAQADNAVNRRQVGWRLSRLAPFLRKGVRMRPNPHGVKDETVRVLRLGSDAVIWNYACHPVFTPRMNHVSADFIGVVRQALRRKLGAETAVLFWQGFSGDVYPSFAQTMVGMKARCRRLLFHGTDAVTPAIWQSWAERLAGHVERACAGASRRTIAGPIQSARASCPLNELLADGMTEKAVGAHKISIGPDLHILGISAEPVTEYGGICRATFKDTNLFCVGCIDDVFGYLPTSQMIHEGGYEAADFLPHFSLRGRLRDQIEQILQDKLLRGVCD